MSAGPLRRNNPMSLLSNILGYFGSNKAAGQVSQGNLNAMAGILGASQGGQDLVAGAGERARTAVSGATDAGNQTLRDVAEGIKTNLDPYLSSGAAGVKNLQRLADTGFKFSYDDYRNDPAFNFEMEQGRNAIQNSAAARGGVVSGNVLQDLTKFGTGLASTYYDQAFQRALKQFDANVDVNRGLSDVGQIATGQFNTAQQNMGNRVSDNTIAAGKYAGDTDISAAEFMAGLKERAARAAGPYAVASEEAHAAGTIGKNNAIAAIGMDLASLIKNLVPGLNYA